MIKKIIVFGSGYVGTSLGVLLAEHYEVILIDVDQTKVKKINLKQAPINEPFLQELLNEKSLNLSATSDYQQDLLSTDLIILALPTNFNEESNSFDTSILESVLANLNVSKTKATIIIKSTIPIGFTDKVSKTFLNLKIVFVPEFLREGRSIQDNINPSRIVVGAEEEKGSAIAEVFSKIAKNSPEIFYMSSTEAEAVKLFANAYLATRVSFFNELDSFALESNLSAQNIIDGLSSDPRIGKGYNNPSFGYGGYCLPKDTRQILANFEEIPQKIFKAVVDSNVLRKNFISQKILSLNPKIVGIFRLVMKKDSDNFRESAIFEVMEIIQKEGKTLIVYEPLLSEDYAEFQVTHNLEYFKEAADIILANRMDGDLANITSKVFTRDIYGEN